MSVGTPPDDRQVAALQARINVLEAQIAELSAQNITLRNIGVMQTSTAHPPQTSPNLFSSQLAERLFHYAPLGLQIFDRAGYSLRTNEAQRRLLGLPSPDYGIGQYNVLTDPFAIETGYAALHARAYQGEVVVVPQRTVNFDDPANQWHMDRRLVTFEQITFPIFDQNHQVEAVVSCLRDTTEQYAVQEQLLYLNQELEQQVAQRTAELQATVQQLQQKVSELARSEERYRLLFENSMDAILIADDQGTYLQANEAACRLLGRTHTAVVGMNVQELQSAGRASEQHYAEYLQVGYQVGEISFYRPNGDLRIAEYVACRIAPNLHQSILRDITERRRTEAQERSQIQALAVLRERERLVRRLHDSFGQMLSYSATQAHAAHDFLAAGRLPMAAASLAALTAAIHEAQQDIREFLFGARTLQAQLGTNPQRLLPSLHQYIQWLERFFGLRVELVVTEPDSLMVLTPQIEVHLSQILQEALSNVHKHAGVATARVTLLIDGHAVHASVHDDGRGFDLDALEQPEHADDVMLTFGLQSMRSRAEELGGFVQITTSPGAGTTITVRVPLQHPGTDQLHDQMMALAQGELLHTPNSALRLLNEAVDHVTRPNLADVPLLTSHQVRVLTLLAEGKTYKQIGKVLGYSERAIRYHISDALQLLNIANRADAIEYVRRRMARGEWPPQS